MKNSLAIALLSIIINSSFAQECKFTVNKKDEFTGLMTRSIVNRIDKRYFTWTSSKIADKYFIELFFYYSGEVHQALTSSDTIQIKLKNERIINLKPVREISPVTRTITSASSYSSRTASRRISTSQLTYYTPTFEVGREVFEELSNSMLVRLRVNVTGKPYDLDLQKRKRHIKGCQRLMSEAKCILAVR